MWWYQTAFGAMLRGSHIAGSKYCDWETMKIWLQTVTFHLKNNGDPVFVMYSTRTTTIRNTAHQCCLISCVVDHQYISDLTYSGYIQPTPSRFALCMVKIRRLLTRQVCEQMWTCICRYILLLSAIPGAVYWLGLYNDTQRRIVGWQCFCVPSIPVLMSVLNHSFSQSVQLCK